MNRRNLLVAGSIAGAALLGADESGASQLAANGPEKFKTKFTPED